MINILVVNITFSLVENTYVIYIDYKCLVFDFFRLAQRPLQFILVFFVLLRPHFTVAGIPSELFLYYFFN